MNTDKFSRENAVTERIIGCAIQVSNELGVGFLEKVYGNALVLELRHAGLTVEQQKVVRVTYRGQIVGDYLADLVVEEFVVVELKATKCFDESHQAQLLNYLKATGFKVGLILNFGTPRLGIKRMVL